MLDDNELLQKCLKHDAKAQEILFNKYKGRIMGSCVRYAGNFCDAQDIFQEAFIRIFKNLEKLRDAKSLLPWMIRTTINTAITYLNKRYEFAPLPDNSYADPVVGPEMIDELSNDELLKLIEELPTGYRIVFNLFAIDGYSHKEIANVLQISESTSKTQYMKAKSYLKKRLLSMGIKQYENGR